MSANLDRFAAKAAKTSRGHGAAKAAKTSRGHGAAKAAPLQSVFMKDAV
jgi:hypothetical protein